jgi:hypothetical protein
MQLGVEIPVLPVQETSEAYQAAATTIPVQCTVTTHGHQMALAQVGSGAES